MSIEEIKSILDCHYINYKIANDCLLAEGVYTMGGKVFSNWVDVTVWNKKAIME